ncbi:MAG TPA: phosphate ABC transporter permease subunit PstC [Pseudogracilibacillus sp.]|nr:phosphate ABC transporter permease subunit PstC [Pseudogracilibacillus sp.]
MSKGKSPINVNELIKQNNKNRKFTNMKEKIIPIVLFLIASTSFLTTIGIVYILLYESFNFFQEVSFVEFFTGTVLKPMSQQPEFGILPLLVGTLTATGIALAVAVPIGLLSAIYLSEYAPKKIRDIVKPTIEILAGIPTIVYGFFAFTFVTPLLQEVFPELEATNILSPGLVMGIMIIPMIASLSEDAMNAVPQSLREGALGLGSSKIEVTCKVVIPAALSGIIASIVLALSRAIGETMIVTIASGSSKNLTFDIMTSMQTMTAYIVEVTGGDAPAGSTIYYSLYAVALTLFVFTLLMNVLANYTAEKLQQKY